MADVIPVQTDGMFGGGSGGMGGLFAGMLMANMMRGGLGMGAAEVAHDSHSDVMQAMNQQQLASSTQIMTQDINRIGHDIATSAAATQATVANGTLQQTVANLQGQNVLSGEIGASTVQNLNSHTNILGAVASGNATTAATINSAANGISNDIRSALGVLDSDLHGMSAAIDNSVARARDDVNRNHREQIEATHRAEINGMRNSFDMLKAVTDSQYATERAIVQDGSLTRGMIQSNAIADRDRMIVVAENKLAEALSDHRHTRSTNDVIINNNANANANNAVLQAALTQQTTQQQINGLAAGLAGIASHLTNFTQIYNSSTSGGSSGNNGNGGNPNRP